MKTLILALVCCAVPVQDLGSATENAKKQSKKLHDDYDALAKAQDNLSPDSNALERRLNDADMAGKASQEMRDALEVIDTDRMNAFNELQNANQNLVDADYWISGVGESDDPWVNLRWAWGCMDIADAALGRADTALVSWAAKNAELDRLLRDEGF
jgi:hypothetical protein